MPFNHFKHPIHYQYPIGADDNVKKRLRKSRQQSKKSNETKDDVDSTNFQIEK